MSLPINVKFVVPMYKAPPPSKVPLWPPLTPPPGKGKAADQKADGGRAARPISTEYLASLKATDGLPVRRTLHGRSAIVKLALTAVPLFALVAVVGVGCAKEKPKVQPQASALDVKRPVPQPPLPAYAGPAYQPPAAASNPPPQPPRAEAVAPAAKPAGTGKTYVVQNGDTLFGIAKTQYGDGNKYKRIAAANPGVNPAALKAGQKIVIPQ